MLQAYVDDSGIGMPPTYWLAGFVAEAEVWEQFSDEWAAALAEHPAILYFKAKEAKSGWGAFQNLSKDEKNAKVLYMKSVLNKYLNNQTVTPISICMGDNAWKAICEVRPFKEGRPTPYQIMLENLCAQACDYYAKKGYNGTIDFIFDSQTEQMERVLANWPKFLKYLTPEQRKMIGSGPIFRNDKSTMPIQAADLAAWWSRRTAASTLDGSQLPKNYWEVDDPMQSAGFIAAVIPALVLLQLADFTQYSGRQFYDPYLRRTWWKLIGAGEA